MVTCVSSETCSGCDSWGLDLNTQRQKKAQRLEQLFSQEGLKPPKYWKWAELPDRGLRDRLDFQIQKEKRGLFRKNSREIEDLPLCLQLSPELQSWWTEFRKIPFQVPRGSFRLRASPDGLRGAWLDFAHEDMAQLFKEQESLKRLLERADQVEIGQRKKQLALEGSQLKLLKKTRPLFWTRTWSDQGPFKLLSKVSDFSQVGDRSNQAIVQNLRSLLAPAQKTIEFGCGFGNLSFPLAEKTEQLDCFEVDPSSAESFELNLKTWEEQAKKGRVQLIRGDSQKKHAELKGVDRIVLNPPRSGVGNFLKELSSSQAEELVYLSCFPETMVQDLKPLKEKWSCEKLILIDQFPQTPHFEALSLWKRN